MGTTYNKQSSLKPVRLSVAEEVAHDENGEDEQGNHEDFEVEIHGFSHCPADEDNQGTVEEGGLDGWAKAVIQGDIDDTICDR